MRGLAICGFPFLSFAMVALVGFEFYEFGDATRAVVIASHAAAAVWGVVCYLGFLRTSLEEDYWTAAAGIPFALVNHFVGPLPPNVCVILATCLALVASVRFVAADDADIHKLIRNFRTPRRPSA